MLPVASSETPGISLLPRTRGPIPERNRKLPTRLACGNAPTGSGARELSKVLLIDICPLFKNRMRHGGLDIPVNHRERGQIVGGVRNHDHKDPACDGEDRSEDE